MRQHWVREHRKQWIEEGFRLWHSLLFFCVYVFLVLLSNLYSLWKKFIFFECFSMGGRCRILRRKEKLFYRKSAQNFQDISWPSTTCVCMLTKHETEFDCNEEFSSLQFLNSQSQRCRKRQGSLPTQKNHSIELKARWCQQVPKKSEKEFPFALSFTLFRRIAETADFNFPLLDFLFCRLKNEILFYCLVYFLSSFFGVYFSRRKKREQQFKLLPRKLAWVCWKKCWYKLVPLLSFEVKYFPFARRAREWKSKENFHSWPQIVLVHVT